MIRSVYHFLGSVRFTLLLIAVVTVVVMGATVLEARTGSHRYAELWAYGSPYFLLLLAGFFLNILLSTLRRWPFSRHHIPFLLTHLGLLALIAGVMVKNLWGVQGMVLLMEGSAADEVLLSNSEGVRIERRAGGAADWPLKGERPFPELAVALVERHPHCRQHLAAWMQGGCARIVGVPPVALGECVDAELREGERWYVYTVNSLNAARALYIEGVQLVPEPEVMTLDDDWTALTLTDGRNKRVIPLEEGRLSRDPLLVVVDEGEGALQLLAFAPDGRVARQRYDGNSFPRLYAYDGGFGGYMTEWRAPLVAGRVDEEARYRQFADLLTQALNDGDRQLASPMAELRASCDRVGCSFVDCMVAYLKGWGKEWLFPNRLLEPYSAAFAAMSWDRAVVSSGGWLSWLLDQAAGAPDFYTFLEESRWPLLERLERQALMPGLMQQLAGLGEPPPVMPTAERLFSAAMRLAGFGPDLLLPAPEPLPEAPLSVNSWLVPVVEPQAAGVKLEENRPMATVKFSTAESSETLSLGYNPTGSGLKWPILNGRYCVRYQPLAHRLPFRLRLRQAERVDYIHSDQPCSYQCWLYVTHPEQREVEVAMAMNQVYETWGGYRFYLGNISGDRGALKTVQLIVNYDPAKYCLSYPGAALVAIGVCLLGCRMRVFRR